MHPDRAVVPESQAHVEERIVTNGSGTETENNPWFALLQEDNGGVLVQVLGSSGGFTRRTDHDLSTDRSYRSFR